ncbi:hypothetical protein BJX99DRAFT_261566 [Aspergillus californicus]
MQYLTTLLLMIAIMITSISGLAINEIPTDALAIESTSVDHPSNADVSDHDFDLPSNPNVTAYQSLDSAPELTGIKVCQYANNGACHRFHDLRQWSLDVANMIQKQSVIHNCNTVEMLYEEIKVKYSATGRNCDTTAELKTIHNAVYNYVNKQMWGSVCGNVCLRLDHGGTWRGYLQMGHYSLFNTNVKCNGAKYGNCS